MIHVKIDLYENGTKEFCERGNEKDIIRFVETVIMKYQIKDQIINDLLLDTKPKEKDQGVMHE